MDFHWSARSGPFGRGGGYPSGGPFWGHFWPFWGLFCHFGSFLTILGSFWSFWGGSPPSGGARIGFRLLQNRWFLGFWGIIEPPRGGRAHLSDYGRKSPKKWHFIRVLRTFRPKNWSTSDLIIVCTRFTFSMLALCCFCFTELIWECYPSGGVIYYFFWYFWRKFVKKGLVNHGHFGVLGRFFGRFWPLFWDFPYLIKPKLDLPENTRP